MKVTFVRHGQTEWNRLGKQQGLADIPLDETGIEQARKTAQLLKDEAFDCVYCSPLKRARQTAQMICEGRNIPIILEQRLIERDMGEFEGMTWHQFDTRAFWDYTADLHYQKAENIRDFYRRVYGFLDTLKGKKRAVCCWWPTAGCLRRFPATRAFPKRRTICWTTFWITRRHFPLRYKSG